MDQLLQEIEEKIQGNHYTPEARAFLRQVSDRIRVGAGMEIPGAPAAIEPVLEPKYTGLAPEPVTPVTGDPTDPQT